MYDTIKVRIFITEEEWLSLYQRCDKTVTYKGDTRIIKYTPKVLYLSIQIPSWDKLLTVHLFENDHSFIFIEFNVSKAYYGHNFFRVNIQQLEEVLSNLNYYFKDLEVNLGNYLKWEVVRVDVSMSYRFNPDTLTSIIKNIKVLRPINFLTSEYPTSVNYYNKRQSHVIKFYDKHAEFMNPERGEFKKYYLHDAVKRGDLLKEYSKGILIFEVSLRERGFFQFFGKSSFTVEELLSRKDTGQRLMRDLKQFIIHTSHMKLSEVLQLIDKHNLSNEVKTNYLKDFLFMTDTSPAVRRLWKQQTRQYRYQVKSRLKKVGIPQDVKNDDTLLSLLSLKSPYYLGSPTREEADKIMQEAVYPTVKPVF